MAIKGEGALGAYKQTKRDDPVKSKGKKLKIGIIGTGGIAGAHIRSYKNMPDAEVVALCDIVPGKAEAYAERWEIEGARYYTDHKEMLKTEKLDGVSICTYNATHAECAVNALNKGLHVLLEKPMCVTTEEAVEMMRAEKKSGKVLAIGFQPRFDANMRKIKDIVQSGELGEVYYIQTGGGRRRWIPGGTFIEQKTAGIGAMGDIGCYSLDMVLNALGYPKPLTVTGYVSDFFGKSPVYSSPADAARFNVEDFAAAFVRLEGGIILDFRISWAMHMDTPGDTLILGKKAGLRIPSTDCWNGTVGGPMTMYTDVAGMQVEMPIPIINGNGPKLFDRKVRAFLDAIKTGGPSPIPSSEILINQVIIDSIIKSAKLGREIEVEIPEI